MKTFYISNTPPFLIQNVLQEINLTGWLIIFYFIGWCKDIEIVEKRRV